LLLQRSQSGRAEDKGTWAAVQAWKPVPDSFQRVFAIRNLGKLLFVAGLVGALALQLFVTHATAVTLVVIAAFTTVGLSVGIVTGLGGQLSLGQFALGGVGATLSYVVTSHGWGFVPALVAAGVVAGVVSLAIGIPALRIRGLMLAVTTLSFALAAQNWVLQQSWMLGRGVNPARPSFAGVDFSSSRSYALIALAVLVVATWLAWNVWRSGAGRQLRSVRDNEDAARAFTVPATRVKVQAFVLGGFLAGLGGAVYGHLLAQLGANAFPIDASINAAAIAVLGGISSLFGPLLGALYIIGVPEFLPLDNAGLAATSLGWLLLILYQPGGITQALR
ncbi:MAG TPA: branched-chain amino acid ABC transporter permease, partial [Acidimicrobiales bacterium]|nr:branched-chain amino acid ABC transporter permease [Acidimicrobiales bacterium]